MAVLFFISFSALLLYEHFQVKKQQKIIVYNVPKYQAVDFVYQDQYFFAGDSILRADALPRNFYLKPSRVSMQLKERETMFLNMEKNGPVYRFDQKTLLIADKKFLPDSNAAKIKVDILLVSGNPRFTITALQRSVEASLIVFDASSPLWKIAQWKTECEILHLQYHSVPEQGACVLDL